MKKKSISNQQLTISNRSFTLIEMIVVVGVIGIALPIFFTIVLVILQQQARIFTLQQVKREGDGILTIMSSVIRNRAASIYSDQALTTPQCSLATTEPYSNSGTEFYFKDKYGVAFNYFLNNNSMSSASANLAWDPELLNSSKVVVSDFTISCYRRATYSSPLVSLSYVVSDLNSTVSLTYKTKINIRSY